MTLPIETVARLDRMATASMLATGLAHEIANPLSCLIAALDGLGVRSGAARPRRGRRAIQRQLDELASELELASVSGNEIFAQVRDFQQYLRPRELETSPAIDLKPPILRAVRMARDAPRVARARSRSRSARRPPVRIPGSRVTQIVLNLLLNAADALGDRPWNANQVEVRFATVEHWAVIEVKDNGPGIDAATRQRLFEPGVTSGKDGWTVARPRLGDLSRAGPRGRRRDSVSSPLTGSTLFRVALPPAAAT